MLFRSVHDSLRAEILDGSLKAGEAIESERILAERFGVNRHAVREALKRLEQAGLILITHGGATKVLDWHDTGGLQVLLDLLGAPGGNPPIEIVRSVVEMRASIGVDAARRSASRADDGQRAEILRLSRVAADGIGGDTGALDIGFATFWQSIVIVSGNVEYRLELNSLTAAILAYAVLAADLRPTDPEAILGLGQAIATGDEDMAVEISRAMLESDIKNFS